MEPLISVIVPIYNVENYLRQCVDSILNQTYPHFELILVNDGSTDSSGRICNEYAEKDSRIKVIHQANAGVSISRNNGIETSTGNFITFVDGDDFVNDTYLENMVTLAVKKNADVIVGLYYHLHESKGEFGFYPIEESEKGYYRLTLQEVIDELADLKYQFSFRHVHGSLFSKALFENCCFLEGNAYGEDMAMAANLYSRARSIYVLEKAEYCYRKRAGATTQRPFTNKDAQDLLNSFKEMQTTLSLSNCDLSKLNERNRMDLTFIKYRMEEGCLVYSSTYREVCRYLDICESIK